MTTSLIDAIREIKLRHACRVTGLLKSGAMKHEDRPIFYEIYKAFPPLKEPKYAQPVDKKLVIKPIFYAEDQERA